MAEHLTSPDATPVHPAVPNTIDEARRLARARFKERLEQGEKIGDCDCADESGTAPQLAEPAARVAGVRFMDSGRTFYFDPNGLALDVGDWVVAETTRGNEAGRVILAPHQVRQSSLQGDLKPLLRKLDDGDVQRMERLKKDAAQAVRQFGGKIRERRLPMKPISAEYNFDGSHLILNFSAPDRVDFRELAKDLAQTFRCRVELRQVGPRDEARLLGGLGRCGRTLCCSSWLPVYPEISMNMAKTQDLPLNPSKVSGVCGRLLCCLSYENEQYRQMKSVMPRLGQPIETPAGPGMVVSMQILKDIVTVRLAADNSDHQFKAPDLGFGRPAPATAQSAPEPKPVAASEDVAASPDVEPTNAMLTTPLEESGSRRRRRRGRGGRGRSDQPAQA